MITFLGDIALLNNKAVSLYKPDGDYIANFEYVCVSKEIRPTAHKINISSPICDFKAVFGCNPIAVGVANNHILDYGLDGFKDTLQNIHEKGVQTIGDKPFWYNKDTCMLAYTFFCGEWQGHNIVQFTKERAKKEIGEAQKIGAKCIIVNIHWGIENHPLPNEDQKKIGRWLIGEGADIVIGHHPHCIQPIEEYKGHYIIYSLGNCLFPSFNVKSHYDENGASHRKYRFNWRRWNNKGLAVVFDETSRKLTRIDELYFKKNILVCTRKGAPLNKYIELGKSNVKIAHYRFLFRKYWLFFVSNSFVDGKLFDFNALKAELRK
jgi:hypothetical protein